MVPLAQHADVLGRYREPARWVLVALGEDPLHLTGLFDAVRRLDGPVGHGTLLATIGRLERVRLIESVMDSGRRTMYRLAILD